VVFDRNRRKSVWEQPAQGSADRHNQDADCGEKCKTRTDRFINALVIFFADVQCDMPAGASSNAQVEDPHVAGQNRQETPNTVLYIA